VPTTTGRPLKYSTSSQDCANQPSVGARHVGNSILLLRTRIVRTTSSDATNLVTEDKVRNTNNLSRHRKRSSMGLGPNAWQSAERSGKDGASQGPPQEQHVPVERFNGQEIRDMLKHGKLVELLFVRAHLTRPDSFQ